MISFRIYTIHYRHIEKSQSRPSIFNVGTLNILIYIGILFKSRGQIAAACTIDICRGNYLCGD